MVVISGSASHRTSFANEVHYGRESRREEPKEGLISDRGNGRKAENLISKERVLNWGDNDDVDTERFGTKERCGLPLFDSQTLTLNPVRGRSRVMAF